MTRAALVAALVLVVWGCGGGEPLGREARLFVVDIESGERSRLTEDGRGYWSPVWSPDGRSLAVVGSEPGRATVEILTPGADESQVVLRRPGYVHGLAWSPRGEELALVRAANETTWVVEAVAPDGAGARRLAVQESSRVDVPGPSWAPDGARLAYAVGGTTFAVAVRGGRARRLGEGSDPRWSPDGRHVLVLQGARLVALPAGGGEPVIVARDLIHATASWSPTGDRVAFSGVTFSGDRRYHLYLARMGSARLRRIADEAATTAPAWSPGGDRLAYATWDGSVRVVDPETGGSRTLTRVADAEVRDLAWSPDGTRMAFVARRVPED